MKAQELINEVSLIVGGSHSTITFTADEVIEIVNEAINTVNKESKDGTTLNNKTDTS